MTAGYRPDYWDAVSTGEREEDQQEPYCRECGSESLEYLETTAEAGHYKCKRCGQEVSW